MIPFFLKCPVYKIICWEYFKMFIIIKEKEARNMPCQKQFGSVMLPYKF